MNSIRMIKRTRMGFWAPALSLGMATAFAALSFREESKNVWLMMSPLGRLFVSGCFLALAAVIELLVMHQQKFIARAVSTEIIVDDVRPLSWSKTHVAAQYHFFTEDRRVITANCAVSEADRGQWMNGARIPAIYDPIRPARHAVAGQPLWATEWTPADSSEEAFDQAVASMIALAPRRAA